MKEEEKKAPTLPQKVGESPEEGKRKKERAPDSRHVEGFLIPEQYRSQSVYRNHPIFRSTLLLLVLTALIGTAGGYQWLTANKLRKTVLASQKLEVGESVRLQNQSLLLRGTREKYNELDILRKQLRIPLGPILDTIEKTIPKEISINDFSMICPPLATSGGSKRRANIRMTVFFPEEVSPTDEKITDWTSALLEKLGENGLKGSKPEWGPQKQFLFPETKRNKEIKGWTRELDYTVELGGNQP